MIVGQLKKKALHSNSSQEGKEELIDQLDLLQQSNNEGSCSRKRNV